jgi:microcystin-dependent protein
MPFIIPNATDTTGGNKYTALDQAEPDSLDFEVLGNGLSGVISGGDITPNANASSVKITAGTVVIDGVVYSVDGNDGLSLGAAPANKRFDLIVARKSGSTVTYIYLGGGDSSANPTFPKSNSNVVTTSTSYYTPSTDILIAAVYREGSTVVSGNIVDKRKFIRTATPYQGSIAPTSAQGTTGDMYVRTGSVSTGESGVYVKRSASGDWTQLAPAFADPGTPIGGIMMWAAPVAPNGAVWKLCDGSPLSKTLYPQLYNVLSSNGSITAVYGESGTNFLLPNFKGMYLVGATADLSASVLSTAVGNTGNEVALISDNVPQHTHPINHSHTGTANVGGSHYHVTGGDVDSARYDFALRRHSIVGDDNAYAAGHYVSPYDRYGSGYASKYTYEVGDNINDLSGMSIWFTDRTSVAPDHTHTVTIGTTSNLTSGLGGQSSPTKVNIQPRSMQIAYYIRYA